jgi:hypothetical protein
MPVGLVDISPELGDLPAKRGGLMSQVAAGENVKTLVDGLNFAEKV